MKKELKSIDELDFILHFIATKPDDEENPTDGESVGNILERLKSTEKSMTIEWLIKILNKLSNDKYVEQQIVKINPYNPILMSLIQNEEYITYKITFDGLVQDELGGYHSIYLENNKLKNIQKWQNRLTSFIAIGAFFTSVYYILEIIKFII